MSVAFPTADESCVHVGEGGGREVEREGEGRRGKEREGSGRGLGEGVREGRQENK
jgi:hypothetical protein